MMDLQTGLTALPLPAFLIDRNLTILWTNPSCRRVSAESLRIEIRLDELLPNPEVAATFRNAVNTLSPGETLERELSLTGNSDNKLSGILTLSRLGYNTDGASFVGVFQDITSRSAMASIMETSFDNFIQTTNNLDQAMQKIKMQRAALNRYRRKMLKELDVARTVQKSIITRDFPKESMFECYGLCRSSDEIGGDYLDVIQFDDGNYGFVVADVSGHGVAPALVATMLRAWVHDIFHHHQHLDTFFAELNTKVYETFNDTGFYLTAFAMILKVATGDLEMCSAGHDALIRIRGTEISDLGAESGGRVIGALPDTTYTYQTSKLEVDDILVCHTDGFSECRNPAGDFYGRPRLAQTVLDHAAMPLTFLLDMVMDDVDSFAAGEKAHDDQTILLLRGKARE